MVFSKVSINFKSILKASFAKHISRHKEWDDVAAMAAASYNYMPNQHSKEAPFFVMFGRDAVTNIGHITVPRYRYMGTEDLILDLEIMSNIYQCQIINLQLVRHRALKLKVGDTQPSLKIDLAVGDLVLIRDHASKTFMPKYKVDFRIVRILGNKVEVKDNHGSYTTELMFASQALTGAEKNYQNLERECLATIWGMEKFHYFLYGKKFTLETDQKPLVSIYKKHVVEISPRIQRLVVRSFHTSHLMSSTGEEKKSTSRCVE